MKEATGEVSGVVITIVIIALVAGVATALFAPGNDGKSIAQGWIENIFNKQVGDVYGD